YKVLYERINDYHIRTGHRENAKLRMAVTNKYTILGSGLKFFNQFEYVRYAIDYCNKFSFLRSLESKHASEAINLPSIFLIFSAFKILQNNNGREFVNSIIIELKELWPGGCVIIYGPARYPQIQYSFERCNQDIKNIPLRRKTDATESVLCNLCENIMKVKETRYLGSKGIQNGAEKKIT
ncbi:Ribonuclease H-like domain, partial [Cinara cedri]